MTPPVSYAATFILKKVANVSGWIVLMTLGLTVKRGDTEKEKEEGGDSQCWRCRY